MNAETLCELCGRGVNGYDHDPFRAGRAHSVCITYYNEALPFGFWGFSKEVQRSILEKHFEEVRERLHKSGMPSR